MTTTINHRPARRPRVLALGLVAALSLCGAGCSKGAYLDGVYSGKAEGVHGPIAVEVTVKGGRIKTVQVVGQEESAGVASLAIKRVPEEIVKAQKTEVDVVSGASSSSKAIMEAAAAALKGAVAER